MITTISQDDYNKLSYEIIAISKKYPNIVVSLYTDEKRNTKCVHVSLKEDILLLKLLEQTEKDTKAIMNTNDKLTEGEKQDIINFILHLKTLPSNDEIIKACQQYTGDLHKSALQRAVEGNLYDKIKDELMKHIREKEKSEEK